jgi:hypothetical protein
MTTEIKFIDTRFSENVRNQGTLESKIQYGIQTIYQGYDLEIDPTKISHGTELLKELSQHNRNSYVEGKVIAYTKATKLDIEFAISCFQKYSIKVTPQLNIVFENRKYSEPEINSIIETVRYTTLMDTQTKISITVPNQSTLNSMSELDIDTIMFENYSVTESVLEQTTKYCKHLGIRFNNNSDRDTYHLGKYITRIALPKIKEKNVIKASKVLLALIA